MVLAAEVATWSKDPCGQVGVIVASRDRRHIEVGYNGFPVGIADSSDRLDSESARSLYTVHAEVNALLKGRDLRGWTLYSTKFPCHECAKTIIQAGVKRVVAPKWRPASDWAESQMLACNLLVEANLVVTFTEGAT
jgi:dCMP deaminase